MTKYYTLLVQEHSNAPWAIEFGDYDRSNVMAERTFMHENSGVPYKNMRVICTGNTQAEILTEVNRLNKEINDYLQASVEIGMTGG